MADVKTLQTRIALKYDTYANWNDATVEGKGANLVLLPGEIGFCEIPSGNTNATNAPTVLFKVGNGEKKFSELNWASALAADVYSWAKASDVRLTGKTIEFVGGKDAEGKDIIVKSIPLNYVTESEVKAITDPISEKVAALEAKFGDADGSVDSKLANHETRIKANEDKLTGVESTVVAAIEASASATKTAYEAADAQVLVDAKAYTDTEAKKVSDAAAEVAADLSAHESASNPHNITAATVGLDKVENKTVAEIKTEFTGAVEADNAGFVTGAAVYTAVEAAKTAANTYADGLNTAMDARVDTLEAAKTAQDAKNTELANAITAEETARGTAVSNEATAREAADNLINEKFGAEYSKTATVADAIADAKKAGTDAQNAIDGLTGENGAITKNTAGVAQNKADIAAEAATRAEEDGKLDTRLQKVEAFFAGAAEDKTVDGEIQNALDTLVEIQNLLSMEEGAAAGELLDAVNENAAAIEELQGAHDDYVEANDAAIDAIEADVEAIEGAIAGFSKDNTVASAIAAAESAAKQEAAAKANAAQTAAEAKAAELANAAQAAAEGTAASALSTAVQTLNAKDAELVAAIEKKLDSASHLEGHAKSATEITTEITNAVNGEKTRAEAAEKAINDKIGTGFDATNTVAKAIEGVKTTAEDAQSRVAAVEPKVAALEALTAGFGEGETVSSKIEAAAELGQQGIDDAAAAQKAADDAQDAADAAQADVDALEKIVSGEDGKSGLVKSVADNASEISAIKGDYLKAADLFIINCGSATEVIHTAE